MAAYSHRRAGSANSLINNGAVGEQELPNGSCNYRDLFSGGRTTNCGCQRFWLNITSSSGQEVGSERAWCFCGHHACFHGAFSGRQSGQELGSPSLETGNIEEQERPTSSRVAAHVNADQSRASSSKPQARLGIRSSSQSQSQSINTRVWQTLNEFARNQEAGGASGGASKLPSTAAPSVVDEARLSPNSAIRERLRLHRSMGPPVHIPQGLAPQPAEDYSATEIATPSIAGTPDLRALPLSNQVTLSPGRAPLGLDTNYAHPEPSDWNHDAPLARPARPSTDTEHRPVSMQDMQNLVRSYGHRLETLESLSFSHVPIEEFHDRLELFDGRVLDLEQWRRDREQAGSSSPDPRTSSSKRRRLRLPSEAGSFESNTSFDSAAAQQAETAVLATLAANAETHPRIDALESRVMDLEYASQPSFARPWRVQLVLLPWGREMKGIWLTSTEATQHSLQAATQLVDEWHGVEPITKSSFEATANGAWTTESIEAWANDAKEWLSPKACGPNGSVFQRLASRGFVQDITLTSSGAHHILAKFNSAFDQLPYTSPMLEEAVPSTYHALQERFLPLRKVPKSARLRFLSPAEMVTSATWTASFLESSVLMKVNDGQRRLYLTTPEAYLQPHNGDWSWERIRQLPIHNATAEEHTLRHQRSAIEACWAFNARLDQQSSLHSSFASHASQWSTRSQLADPNDKDRDSDHQPISPQSELPPIRHRTVSLPSSTSAAGQPLETIPARRIASFEPATLRRPLDFLDRTTTKRRRISASPDGVNSTSRHRSREPPSPFTSETRSQQQQQQVLSVGAGAAVGVGAGTRKRAPTPSAYATPFSNSTLPGRMEFFDDEGQAEGDGDTEAATDVLSEMDQRGEEEWMGVEEEDGNGGLDDGSEGENEEVC